MRTRGTRAGAIDRGSRRAINLSTIQPLSVRDRRPYRCDDLASESPELSWHFPSPAVGNPGEGPVTYKGTTSPAIESMRDGMSANMKNKSAGTPGANDKAAAKTEKPAEKKQEPAPAPEKSK